MQGKADDAARTGRPGKKDNAAMCVESFVPSGLPARSLRALLEAIGPATHLVSGVSTGPVIGQDQIGGAFRDDHHGHLRVARDHRRHDGGVDDAQPGEPLHPEPRIDDGAVAADLEEQARRAVGPAAQLGDMLARPHPLALAHQGAAVEAVGGDVMVGVADEDEHAIGRKVVAGIDDIAIGRGGDGVAFPPRDLDAVRLEDRFRSALGTRVSLKRPASGGAGSITIHFHSDEELQGLYERIIGEDLW